MIYGLSGRAVSSALPYATPINVACMELGFSPPLAYAIAQRETIRGQIGGLWDAATIVSTDDGHGLFQLTSSWPAKWNDPLANARYAIGGWLVPSMHHYATVHGLAGDELVKAIADSFNAGDAVVCRACREGTDPDRATSGRDYGSDVLANYKRLVAGLAPK